MTGLAFDVRWRRGDFALDIEASASPGVWGILGHSGAGKSTLLHLLAGLATPDSGRIALDGRILFDCKARRNLPAHRRAVALVFQRARLFPHMSVRANLDYAGKHAQRGRQIVSFDEVVEELEIAGLLSRRPRSLSGGEAQRTALARSLLAHPRALLLDEPLSALDPRLKRRALNLLRKIAGRSGLPILYVTHEIGEFLQIGEMMLIIESGRLEAHGRYLDLMMQQRALRSMQSLGLVSLLRCRAVEHRREQGITRWQVVLGEAGTTPPVVNAPLVADPLGTERSLALRPQDIALSAQHVCGISVQNQWPGTIRRLVPHEGQVFVEVDVGLPMIVEVTSRTITSMGLEPGSTIWCLFKSNALRYL